MPEAAVEGFEAPTWDYLYELCIVLADLVRASEYKPDILVGVARGGWIPARLLSDFLENPNMANVKVEFYLDINKTAHDPVITQPVSVPVAGKRVLIVDDVADSGKSLKLVKESLQAQGAAEVRVACAYYKPWSILKPDYYAKETRGWVIFPHEVKETVRKVCEKLRGEGRSIKDVKAELVRIGLKPLTVEKFVREICEGK